MERPIVIALLLALAACGGGGSNDNSAAKSSNTSSNGGNSQAAPSVSGSTTPITHWQPLSPLRWQIQFTQALNTSLDVDVYEFDGFDITAATISSLHQQGRKIICYIDAGTWENWRSDASQFPASLRGNGVHGSSRENWLNIGDLTTLAPLMKARLDMAQGKGCDGIDPDNIDGYTQNTGFSISSSQQISYNQFLANEAHARGMAIGLKNDMDQIGTLIGDFDYALNESCFANSECNLLAPFTNAGKPIFNIEYSNRESTGDFCSQANSLNFNSILKSTSLDASVSFCR